MRLNSGNEPGELVRIVGYGPDEKNNIGGRNTRSGVVISEVGASNFRPQGDRVPTRMFVVQGAVECHGDSGGPALSAQNAVVGVFSQVSGPCFASTARDFFTQVAPFKDDLILPAFAAANAEPIVEVIDQAGAGGAAGAASDGPDPGSSGSGAASDLPSAGAASDVPSAGAPSTDEDPSYGGPRQPGGCKCHLGTQRAGGLDPEAALALMLCAVAYARRRRANAG
jgi:hypothetical protein